MKNDRFTDTFITAMFLGYPLALVIDFEAYILAEGQNDESLVPIIYSLDMDFALPGVSRGPVPFIHSITRAPVSANQPVTISVSGSDEGTGISNRTYIYYSIDGGASWDKSLLTGGEWCNEYAGVQLDSYFPILSTIQPELYEGEIPSFPAGTQVLFKVYLEDYAANIDHKDKGNWVWSQTYSYIVPRSGALPEFTVEFKKVTETTSTKKMNNYLELNGFIQPYFLFSRGINTNVYVDEGKTLEVSRFLYENDVDSSYAVTMLLLDTKRSSEVMADSGLSSVRLLNILGITVKDLFGYIVDNIFLPTKQETTLTELAQPLYKGITIIDDIEGYIPPNQWHSSPSGTVGQDTSNYLKIRNNDPIGDRSIKWILSEPSNISRDFSSDPRDLSKNDILSFYIDYDDYSRLNGNLSVTLIDNNGRKMSSKQIYFEETAQGTFQEIALSLNSNNFEIDPGFNFGAIHQINFTYSGTEGVTLNIDYILAYSTSSYELHKYLIDELQLQNQQASIKTSFLDFYRNYYQGTGWGSAPPMPSATSDPILKDWEINQDRTAGWNFINLVTTNGTMDYDYGPDPNHHMCAAATFLQHVGFPNGYKKLCELLGAEIEEFEEEPFTKEEIYSYTQSVGMMMVYIPLGAIATLAIVLRVREHRYKTKVKKIRTKYKKIGKR
ncbi:MAG: hypothetical protein ACFFD2_27130, partial [Promethearchaeota archaeon]